MTPLNNGIQQIAGFGYTALLFAYSLAKPIFMALQVELILSLVQLALSNY